MAGHVRKLATAKWQARWYEASGRERTRVFPRKSDAEKHLTFVNNALLSGTYIDATAGKMTVGALAEQWFAGKVNLKATTRARVRSLLDVHVLPHWKSVPVARVEHSAVQAWVGQLVGRGQSAASVKKIHGVLSGVLAMAVRDRRLASNPCDGVNLPRVSVKPHTYLTAQQVASLATAGATPNGKSRGARTEPDPLSRTPVLRR